MTGPRLNTAAAFLIGIIAAEHFAILILEMFFWDHPAGRRIFGMTPEVSAASATLAANQGLYNGFLAAGLVWGLVSKRADVCIFFLFCVLAAGIFGGVTAKTSIILTQAMPAAIALILIWLSRSNPAGRP